MSAKVNLIRSVFIIIIGAIISLSIMYGPSLYKSFYEGEFTSYILNEKTTVYLFYDEQNEGLEKRTYQNFKNVISVVGGEFQDTIDFRVIENDDPKMYIYESDFRLDTYPRLIIIDERGYMVAHYKDNITPKQLYYVLDFLTK